MDLHDVEPDARRLGVYGFRNRNDHTYDGHIIADSTAIKAPRLWESSARAGRRVDRARRPRHLSAAADARRDGHVLPHAVDRERYTYPPGAEGRDRATSSASTCSTCADFRTDDKDGLLGQVYEMTDKRFLLAEHLLETRPWQLFAMVEMGHDRIHHGFWKYMDPEHRKHEPGQPVRATRSSTTTGTSTA